MVECVLSIRKALDPSPVYKRKEEKAHALVLKYIEIALGNTESTRGSYHISSVICTEKKAVLRIISRKVLSLHICFHPIFKDLYQNLDSSLFLL